MPRKRNEGPTVPKPPRVRKKKADTEKKLDMPVYDPVMQTTGMMIEDGMYTQDYGYAYGSQGPAPPQYSNDSQSSPFMTPACSTPQPIIMRHMTPQNVAPSTASVPNASQPPSGPLGPTPTPLEFRIHDMNRRLYTFNNSGINEQDHKQWFEAFSHEFFDDEAMVILHFPEERENNLPAEKSIIHRNLIARFFLSFVEAKAKEVYFVLRGATREQQNSATGLIHFENDNVLFVQRLENPYPCQIEAECKLTIEFTPYDEMLNHRVRLWTMDMRVQRELYFNEATKELQQVLDPKQFISRAGICPQSINFMKMARILEPMQVLMAHSKAHHVTEPKELIRRTLFHHQNKMQDMSRINTPMIPSNPVEEAKPKPARKRTRKPPANPKNKKANASPAPSNPSFPTNPMQGSFKFNTMGYQDVMVVGEPSMMGGDYGEEDERTISRVENSQYDPNALQKFQMQQAAMDNMGAGMMPPPGSLPPNGPPHMPHPNGVPHGGMPSGLPPHPGMGGMGPPPPQNGMPPPYGYQPQGAWPNNPNTTMITG